MQSSTHKAMLFGGAVFAAGVVNAAQAQWTIEDPPWMTALGAYGYSSVSYLKFYGDFVPWGQTGSDFIDFDSYNDPGIGGSAGAEVAYTFVSAFLDLTPGTNGIPNLGYASVNADALVRIPVGGDLRIDWDFTEIAVFKEIASIRVTDFLTGDSVLSIYDGAGSTELDLEDDRVYELSLSIRSQSSLSAHGSITLIPLPGVLAMLGVAGMFDAQRRRRRRMHI